MAGGAEPLLAVSGLATEFPARHGAVRAVDGVSFDLRRGECLGIVGESGSGKSVTALSIMGLLQKGNGRVAGGQIRFNGADLLSLSSRDRQQLRGADLAMIFQEPMTSLNPVFTVGQQIAEAVRIHKRLGRTAARRRAVEMLDLVGIPDPHRRVDSYPHQLSGGMRQRVMIAMALSCDPKLLIADEPTTALDVTIQAQILELLRDIRKRLGTAIIMITHDLGVIAELADRVIVMYASRIVETGSVRALFKNPQHPYTQGLLRSMPRLDEDRDRLDQIEGSVPNPTAWPGGCRFHPRCGFSRDICSNAEPPTVRLAEGRRSACWRHVDYDPGQARQNLAEVRA